MSRAATVNSSHPTDAVNRRLAAGVLLSVLLHGLVLSLQFGIPGLKPGRPAPLTITLAPSPKPVPTPELAGPAQMPEPALAQPPSPRVPATGLHVVEPVEPPKPTPAPKPAKRRRAPARRVSSALPRRPPERLKERVIAQERNPDAAFTVPVPEPEKALEKTPDRMAVQDGSDTGTGQAALKVEEADTPVAEELARGRAAAEAEVQRVADEQARRTLALQKQEARRHAEDAVRRLATERELLQKQAQQQARLAQQRVTEEQARAQAEQQAQLARQRAMDEQARLQAQQQAVDEQARRLAQQRIAEEQARQQREADAVQVRQRAAAEEQARVLALQRDEQLHRDREALELAARKQAEEEARRQAMLRQRELDELAAKQQAEQLALLRQAEEMARRDAAELAARTQAEQLAQQRAAEQLAARRRAEELARQQAEQETRQRAEQAARRAAQLAASEQRGRANERVAGNEVGGIPGAASGDGLGAGGAGGPGAPPRNMLGGDFASRARELVRGIDIPGSVPPAARPAEEEQLARRRAVSWGPDRDVPLRLYVDSFRQKVERNGTLNGAQLSADRVRTDPLVSVVIRSDGSVEEVTIVRSSGRPETDEAVRRIVRVNARYSAFPPNVAARYDVIEIRRIWAFAEGLKLLEEVR